MAKLRIAYAGHDFFSSCLAALLRRADVDVVLCLTSPPGHPTGNVLGLAHRARVPVVQGRPTEAVVATFNSLGVDLLVSAAYLYRIPVQRLAARWAVNVHPSLLPAGRGPNPLPYLVDDRRDACGITLHEMSPEFDAGDVLLQEPVELSERDGFDELFLRLFAAAPRLLDRLLDDVEKYFSEKRPQGSGSYWPEHTPEQRLLVADRARVGDAVALHAKFGAVGVLVQLADERRVNTDRVTAVECAHDYTPGTVVARLVNGWVVALVNGLMRIDSPQPAV
ncbi:methionyl-tRNA formyltransferase [Saccharothrix hoggarensis]|uniref:Methionyl-tRNA formyltransferase n=1 Tax=Saccharothrix hoggarensis TaxID=913853 RepID=A0ABW3QT76_9PSEU